MLGLTDLMYQLMQGLTSRLTCTDLCIYRLKLMQGMEDLMYYLMQRLTDLMNQLMQGPTS